MTEKSETLLYRKLPASFDLVDLQTIDATILIELKYATEDNFTGRSVYHFKRCFLLKPVAMALKKVQEKLKGKKISLKVWDGFRPISAQWKLWQICPDPKFVADPRKGGFHTRGSAVDVTLATFDGKELPMPSSFDDFSEKSHVDYKGSSVEAMKNRELLQQSMKDAGFIPYAFEWWHFDFHDWEKNPPILEDLDLNFQ